MKAATEDLRRPKRWEIDPHPDGVSVHDELATAYEPDLSFYLDTELMTKEDAARLARRLNEHGELLEALKDVADADCSEWCGGYHTARCQRSQAAIARAEAP